MWCSRFGPRLWQSWNHPPVVPTAPSHLVRPSCPTPTPVSSADLPMVGRQGDVFGLAHHSTAVCLLLAELMLGSRRGRRPCLPRGAEHPRGRVGYLLKASCSRVPYLIVEGLDRGPRWGTEVASEVGLALLGLRPLVQFPVCPGWVSVCTPTGLGSGSWRTMCGARPMHGLGSLAQPEGFTGTRPQVLPHGSWPWQFWGWPLLLPGLDRKAAPAPPRPTIHPSAAWTAGHLAPWSSCSYPANIGFLPSLPLPLFSPK